MNWTKSIGLLAVLCCAPAARGALLFERSLVVDRSVLEWRLDPASPHRLAEVTGYDQRVILVCNEGYSSSLAAATLHDLGLTRATDLIGGFQAWRAGGAHRPGR